MRQLRTEKLKRLMVCQLTTHGKTPHCLLKSAINRLKLISRQAVNAFTNTSAIHDAASDTSSQ